MRHGVTDMTGRLCGHSDPPLNSAGRAQIERAVSLLPTRPDVVFTSDLLRARESAQILAARFGVPVQTSPGLREIDFGAWEGLSWQEVEQRFPAESKTWMDRFPAGVIPAGERYDVFVDRVKREMDFLVVQAQANALIAVTHAGFIRTALTEIYGTASDEAFRLSGEYGAILDLSQADAGAE
ncbi:MAG: histidine phosphatase family protein [Acidobacteriota bacterium]